jgi:hypothetical protein
MDPHQIERWDPDPHQKVIDPDTHQFADTSQNVWSMSLFEHFFKVLSLYLEVRIQPRIRIKVKSRILIRICISNTV